MYVMQLYLGNDYDHDQHDSETVYDFDVNVYDSGFVAVVCVC